MQGQTCCSGGLVTKSALFNIFQGQMCGGGDLVAKSCLTLAIPWTLACQPPLSMEFSRQEHWSGLTFPSPGDLSNPGPEPMSPGWQVDSLPLKSPEFTSFLNQI